MSAVAVAPPASSVPAAAPGELLGLPSQAALVAWVAQRAAMALSNGIAQRGRATLVCSGGATPRAYLPALAALDLPWAAVTVTQADERWVATDDALSNARLVHDTLLQGPAAQARWLGLRGTATTVEQAATEAAAALGRLAHPYELVLLGMGDDGHFASLFPHSATLAAALDPASTVRCIAVAPPTTVPPAVARLSMTFAEILASRAIVVVLQGDGKRRVFEAAAREGDPRERPIAALIAQTRKHPGAISALAPTIDCVWCP